MHSQLLHVGEGIWTGYFELRFDAAKPSWDRNLNIETELQRLMAEADDAVEDEWDSLAPEPVDENILRQSLEASQQQCEVRYDKYEDASKIGRASCRERV